MEKLIIFDTTLRDGEQCPGASMNTAEKIQVAQALESLNVDVIEAGFPITSPDDFNAVQEIAKVVKDSTIAALARTVPIDIEQAGKAIKPANSGRIHTFISTSAVHMKHKLNLDPDQVLERTISSIKLAASYTDDIEFSAEDAGRSELDFLCRVFEAAIKAGATTINVPDTVGYLTPDEYGSLIANCINRIPNADKAVFSTHCHNDLGLAVANSLAGVINGARQVECTINGIGERAGNASLEEIVMAVKTRNDFYKIDTGITTTKLVPTSQLVSQITGFAVQRNKAIVGINAFAHEAGIHQDGILKRRETYEIMRAEDVGWESNHLILGKHSGRNAFKVRMQSLGFPVDDQSLLDAAFAKFKDLADQHKRVDDGMLKQIMQDILSKDA